MEAFNMLTSGYLIQKPNAVQAMLRINRSQYLVEAAPLLTPCKVQAYMCYFSLGWIEPTNSNTHTHT